MEAWLQAARPLAQANIAPALLFGCALAFRLHNAFEIELLTIALLFGVVDQLFILFTNDWADHETDQLNEVATPFSGGSRVLVEGKLSRQALGRGAIGAGLGVVAVSGFATIHYDRDWLAPLAAMGILLVWAYTLKPIQLAYRGHGELLQGAGVGLVLPLAGYTLQCDRIDIPAPLLLGCFMVGYAGNITTSLPDFVSDQRSHKRSHPVRLGERRARIHSLVILLGSSALLAGFTPGLAVATRALVFACGALPLLPNLAGVGQADASDHPRVRRFVVLNLASITLQWIAPSLAMVLG
jgi:1,4-dihydroxy-2-naphthoate octaprenyltransferase